MTTSTYKDFPFTVSGINFVSRVYSHSPFMSTIERLPAGIFEAMNIQAVSELITVGKTYTLLEIEQELQRINAGGSHAFLMLGDN